MSRPRSLWRVEWSAARHPDRPNDRTRQERNFTSADNAAAQVVSVRLYEPKFMELHGVWRTTGGHGELEWEPVDPDSLPVHDLAEARAHTLREHSPPYADMMGEHE